MAPPHVVGRTARFGLTKVELARPILTCTQCGYETRRPALLARHALVCGQPEPEGARDALVCPTCGWVKLYGRGLSPRQHHGIFGRHTKRCAVSEQEEREHFLRTGVWLPETSTKRWRRRVGLLTKSREVPVAAVPAGPPPEPKERRVGSIWRERKVTPRFYAYTRTGLGEDKLVGWAQEPEKVVGLASRATVQCLEQGHAGVFLLVRGVESILPGEEGGVEPATLGEGTDHWARVQQAARQLTPPRTSGTLSRRENAELWLQEQRDAQDRARCVEDVLLLTLRLSAGKWVDEGELFKVQNATSEELLVALSMLKSCGLAESHGSLWRAIL